VAHGGAGVDEDGDVEADEHEEAGEDRLHDEERGDVLLLV